MSRTASEIASLFELDCYSKSKEELAVLKSMLDQEIKLHNKEIMKHTNEIRLINRMTKKIAREKLNCIETELQRREDIEHNVHILDDCRTELDGFSLLSELELTIISTKMCRQDYRSYGCPRWRDVVSICNTVITMKKKYPTWKLVNMFNIGNSDTTPPKTFYKYEYVDDDGCHFNVGGMNILKTEF
jgi:hypothetical protein